MFQAWRPLLLLFLYYFKRLTSRHGHAESLQALCCSPRSEISYVVNVSGPSAANPSDMRYLVQFLHAFCD